LFKKFNIDAVPFNHSKIDTWRENFEGVQYQHPQYGFVISGAVDDLWQLSDGLVAVIDYKSTAKNELDMTSKWVQRYYRQLEVYQWLLRHNDVDISNTAFILYANGDTGAERFDGKIQFRMSLYEHVGDTSWIEPVLAEIYQTLESDDMPKPGKDCEVCEYEQMRNSVINDNPQIVNSNSENAPKTLFD
jgi:hypothetical protein